MAHPRENQFNPASPETSNGVTDSYSGTPDSHLATQTPEDVSAEPSVRFYGSFPFRRSAPSQRAVHNYRLQSDRDPFVSSNHGTALSPTASSFRPAEDAVDLDSPHEHKPVALALSTELGLSRHLCVSSCGPISISEVDSFLSELAEKGRKAYDSREMSVTDGQVQVHFSDIRDACSSCSALRQARKAWVVRYANENELTKDALPNGNHPAAELGQVTIGVTPSPGVAIDAIQAAEISQKVLQPFGRLFAFIRQVSSGDGCFKAIAQFCNPSAAVAAIHECDDLYVEGVYLNVIPYQASPTYDITSSIRSVSLATGTQDMIRHPGVVGRMAPGINGTSNYQTYPAMPPGHIASQYGVDRISHGGPMAPSYSVMGPMWQAPPSPALTSGNDYSPSRATQGYGRFDGRRQNASRVPRSSYHTPNHHNQVDIGRIRDGIDVRTTIMLRNIPNKVDQVMLKRIIDESSWGKYDFMYLRIDFANDCNVGYAFINFVDKLRWWDLRPPIIITSDFRAPSMTVDHSSKLTPLDIIDFANARGNQKWNCFKSDKVAEISYATIQGKDCLVQKFRNSSVMLEPEHYRPKLYYTLNGPVPELAGQEEEFPEPDNQSKMRRSVENAEHVGLFTPNAGQYFRDEQRRRRSRYDRGTRLAALEEFDYQASPMRRGYRPPPPSLPPPPPPAPQQ